ncbi:hypothetical protein ACFLUU_03680 [Chloroflexota bacterium]
MSDKTMKAIETEVAIFTSGEYNGDVEAFQNDVNSWFKSQPDDVLIEDVIYRHCGVSSRGKDIFSIAIISRLIRSTDKKP